jgi:hypothetical protein
MPAAFGIQHPLSVERGVEPLGTATEATGI